MLFVLIGLEFAVIVFPPGSFVAVVLVDGAVPRWRDYLVVGLPTTAGARWLGLPRARACC